MGSVLHLRKELVAPPVEQILVGVGVRSIAISDDVEQWLKLRKRATAGLTPPVREWTIGDFAAEMLQKPWWHEENSWVAVVEGTSIIGTVTLGVRTGAASSVAIVHWLLVDPAWRRRGIGRLLMAKLERAAWDAGWREVAIETHARWTDAVAFYQSMGYAPVLERSPR